MASSRWRVTPHDSLPELSLIDVDSALPHRVLTTSRRLNLGAVGTFGCVDSDGSVIAKDWSTLYSLCSLSVLTYICPFVIEELNIGKPFFNLLCLGDEPLDIEPIWDIVEHVGSNSPDKLYVCSVRTDLANRPTEPMLVSYDSRYTKLLRQPRILRVGRDRPLPYVLA